MLHHIVRYTARWGLPCFLFKKRNGFLQTQIGFHFFLHFRQLPASLFRRRRRWSRHCEGGEIVACWRQCEEARHLLRWRRDFWASSSFPHQPGLHLISTGYRTLWWYVLELRILVCCFSKTKVGIWCRRRFQIWWWYVEKKRHTRACKQPWWRCWVRQC